MKTQVLVLACFVCSCIGVSCNQTANKIATVAQIKSLLADPAASTGKTFNVEGYFLKDPAPYLVTALKWANMNNAMPDSTFIPLEGAIFDTLQNINAYQGAFLQLEGVLSAAKKFVVTKIHIEKPAERNFVLPVPTKLCYNNKALCEVTFVGSSNMALLYSSVTEPGLARSRYWNDLKFLYHVLKSKYGYTDERIVIVYNDGKPLDDEMPVNFAATKEGFAGAMAALKGHLTNTSVLFIYTTGHGGGYYQALNTNIGGVKDAVGDDEKDAFGYDETFGNGTITDDDWESGINHLQFAKLIGVFQQSFGGGLLYDLRGLNRVLISAGNEFEASWGPSYGNHDMFSFHFISALNGARHDGFAVDADLNNDGLVTLLEIFLFAKTKTTPNEHPQLEDTGDGVSTDKPSGKIGTEGALANKTIFK
ncbi:hypothetical protein LX64_01794 [Chitinophaga skermanii]|uniref:Peptidase C25-like protein n=1 Tax=Chitinophaga skermanii TaxID=331697 RepID=A0A327QYB4_9BACT|nr:hypothetical protein [Chitinophaga skermanii]RAJ06667.1 hypothetical protein LX64_01794 [Chitinophaga skermanii]